jgi:hypothetical protein
MDKRSTTIIVNDRRAMCDACMLLFDEGLYRDSNVNRADWVMTTQPVISQFAGDGSTEMYLCNRHRRLLMKAFDAMIESSKDRLRAVSDGQVDTPGDNDCTHQNK